MGSQGNPSTVIECFKSLFFNTVSDLNNDPVFQAFKENEIVGVSRKDNLIICMGSFQQFYKVTTFYHIFSPHSFRVLDQTYSVIPLSFSISTISLTDWALSLGQINKASSVSAMIKPSMPIVV